MPKVISNTTPLISLELGLVEKMVPLLDDMQKKGIWISNKLKEKILAIVNE